MKVFGLDTSNPADRISLRVIKYSAFIIVIYSQIQIVLLYWPSIHPNLTSRDEATLFEWITVLVILFAGLFLHAKSSLALDRFYEGTD